MGSTTIQCSSCVGKGAHTPSPFYPAPYPSPIPSPQGRRPDRRIRLPYPCPRRVLQGRPVRGRKRARRGRQRQQAARQGAHAKKVLTLKTYPRVAFAAVLRSSAHRTQLWLASRPCGKGCGAIRLRLQQRGASIQASHAFYVSRVGSSDSSQEQGDFGKPPGSLIVRISAPYASATVRRDGADLYRRGLAIRGLFSLHAPASSSFSLSPQPLAFNTDHLSFFLHPSIPYPSAKPCSIPPSTPPHAATCPSASRTPPRTPQSK